MATGTVKWFNAQKGYGFIQPETPGADVFVHISAVERAGMDNLREGQKLSYELEQGQRGRVSAVNLRPVCGEGGMLTRGRLGAPVPLTRRSIWPRKT